MKSLSLGIQETLRVLDLAVWLEEKIVPDLPQLPAPQFKAPVPQVVAEAPPASLGLGCKGSGLAPGEPVCV